jgi:manganese transport protein
VNAIGLDGEGMKEFIEDTRIEDRNHFEALRAPWVRKALPLLGPAFVASIAYVDPGNFATNVVGGAQYGYLLLWVVLTANVMAILIQYLSAKVGIATGQSLPELCREHFTRPASRLLWLQAELVCMATDLAEFVGAALALHLLFGLPPLQAGLLTAVLSFAILALQPRSFRWFEAVIIALFAAILGAFLYQTLAVGFDASDVAHGLVPRLADANSVLLATGIVGATVMPHVIYLHSALTPSRVPRHADEHRRRLVLGVQRYDIVVAMGLAGLTNAAMLIVAAAAFHGAANPVDSLPAAHAGLSTTVGAGTALAFALALLASGIASSSVGTYAGQVVMQGFIQRTIPLFLRRLLTMAPALVVLGLGLDASYALVLSQVMLSFGIPFALIPLLIITARENVMGSFVNRKLTSAVGGFIAFLIIGLNCLLLALAL